MVCPIQLFELQYFFPFGREMVFYASLFLVVICTFFHQSKALFEITVIYKEIFLIQVLLTKVFLGYQILAP